MARCPRCRRSFRTLEDEAGMHDCPHCGLGPDEPFPPKECEDCGEPATRRWDEGADYAFWTRQPRYTPVCEACWTRRDNREPPEPDGEAFRGGEAAAYLAEQQDRARRLK